MNDNFMDGFSERDIRIGGAVALIFFPLGLPIALLNRTWRYFAGAIYAVVKGRIRSADGF